MLINIIHITDQSTALQVVICIIGALVGWIIAFGLSQASKLDWSGFSNKTTWHWLELLFIPILLGLSTFYLNFQLKQREVKTNKQKAENQRILKYISEMRNILKEDVNKSESDDLSEKEKQANKKLMESLTGSSLYAIESPDLKREIIKFLSKTDLIQKRRKTLCDNENSSRITPYTPYKKYKLSLKGMDLQEANLAALDLRCADFTGADLKNTNFNAADLRGAILENVKINKETKFEGANAEYASFGSEFEEKKPNLVKAWRFYSKFSRNKNFEIPENIDFNGERLNIEIYEEKIKIGNEILELEKLPSKPQTKIKLLALDKAVDDENLTNLRLKKAKIRNRDLQGKDLSKTNLEKATLENVTLSYSVLKNAILRKAKLIDVDLKSANLEQVNLEGAELDDGTNLSDSYLFLANLKGATLKGVNLKEATLVHVKLQGAKLQGANLQSANLKNVKIDENTNFSKAYLRDTEIDQDNFKEKLPKPFRAWQLLNRNDESVEIDKEQFRGKDLSNLNLTGSDLSDLDLTSANLRNTKLKGANLQDAIYDKTTVFPKDFDPENAGLKEQQKPNP